MNEKKVDLTSLEGILGLIGAFAPLAPIPENVLIGKLSGIAGELVAEWRRDSGMEPAEQLAAAHIQGDENAVMLLEDLARIADELKTEKEPSEAGATTQPLNETGDG